MDQYETLYKKDVTGKTRFWFIEQDGAKYRTVSGSCDSALEKETRSAWTVCVIKNLGKSHETTPEEQAESEIASCYEKKRKEGYAEEGAVAVELLKPMLAHEYKKRLPKIRVDNRFLIDAYAQPKLDGIRCLATKDGLFSRKGELIVSCPHISAALSPLFGDGILKSDFVFDGELYNHDLKDDFEEIASLVRKRKNLTTEDFAKTEEVIQYHIYDAIKPGTFSEREMFIKEIIEEMWWEPSLVFVPSTRVASPELFDKVYEKYLEAGYEGAMLRLDTPYEGKRSNNLLKRKEFMAEEFEIVDFIEGIGNRSNMLGAVQCRLPDGRLFKSNIKGGYQKYTKLWLDKKNYIGKKATVTFQCYTAYSVPRFPVIKDINRID